MYGTVTVFRENDCFKNYFGKNFTVNETNLPDLFICDEDIEVDPDPQVGEIVIIKVTVHNIGEADAGEFYILILINGKKLH